MPTPTVIADRYHISRSVGRGGMAEVYLATDERLSRPVAIKVLHDEYATNEAFLQRFDREARAAAAFHHPNIVGVYDYGRDSTNPYLVMEYVRGKTLRELLQENGTPSYERGAEVIASVAGALAYAHEHGIVHRDVKPGNIMIDVEGVVKVADFGIAQLAGANAEITQAGSVVGTAAYLAPEQAQGKPADARSDVYSLGCVLYELLCGRPPFEGETPWAIAYQHVNDPVVPPSQIQAGVPPALEAITLKALAKDPNQRYPSATELRNDLERYRRGEMPIAFGTTGATAAPATATMPAATVAAAYAAGAAPGATGESAFSPVAQLVPEKRKKLPAIIGIVALVTALVIGLGLLGYVVITMNQKVAVPDVTGQTVNEAKTRLRAAGFDDLDVVLETSPTIPKDRVTRTDPAKGTNIETNKTVKLFVSSGPEDVDTPNVVNQPQADALNILKAGGFQWTISSRPDDKAEGTVLEQDPAAGAKVPPGTTVTLVVSSGPPLVTVPNVEGAMADQAVAALQQAGFTATQSSQDADQPEGTVVSQQPAPNSQVPKGSTVAIVVSAGRKVTVPDLKNLTQGDAQTQLTKLGLTVNAQQVIAQNDCLVDRVCYQDPAANSRVAKGTSVKIFVGIPAPTTTTTTVPPAPPK